MSVGAATLGTFALFAKTENVMDIIIIVFTRLHGDKQQQQRQRRPLCSLRYGRRTGVVILLLLYTSSIVLVFHYSNILVHAFSPDRYDGKCAGAAAAAADQRRDNYGRR